MHYTLFQPLKRSNKANQFGRSGRTVTFFPSRPIKLGPCSKSPLIYFPGAECMVRQLRAAAQTMYHINQPHGFLLAAGQRRSQGGC